MTSSSGLQIPQVGFFDFLARGCKTVDGVSTTLKVFQCLGGLSQYMPLSKKMHSSIERINSEFFKTDAIIGSFGLLDCVCDLKNSSISLFHSNDSTSAATTTASKVGSFARSTLSMINSASDVANNFHEAGFISLGRATPVSSAIFAATDVVGCALDMHQDISEIRQRSLQLVQRGISPQRKLFLNALNTISKCKVVTGLIGIAGSGLALASLIAGTSLTFPILGLLLSSLWLGVKIYTQYAKACVRKIDFNPDYFS